MIVIRRLSSFQKAGPYYSLNPQKEGRGTAAGSSLTRTLHICACIGRIPTYTSEQKHTHLVKTTIPRVMTLKPLTENVQHVCDITTKCTKIRIKNAIFREITPYLRQRLKVN